ncbi:hypothetical protein L0222_18160 [bacterium]|nr:hypothetical protein [bacterium]
MSYPRIWLALAPLGINQSHTELLGWSLGLSFFIAVIVVLGRLKPHEATICSAVLLSPAVMLGVERGNTDLFIFILLTFSALSLRGNTFSSALGYLLILVSAVLKLFPAFAIVAVLKERRNYLIVIILLFSAAFIGYIVYTLDDLFLIQNVVRRSTYMSYGALNFLHILTDLISPSIYEFHHKLLTLLSLVLAFLLVVVAFLYIRLSGLKSLDTQHINAFRLGAGLYIGTFVFMENWDYRLIFLIFTLPQIFLWIRKESAFRNESIVALTAMVLTLWMSRWKYDFIAGEILNLLLFVYFLAALHHTLPEFVRIPMQRFIGYVHPEKQPTSSPDRISSL